MTDLSQSLAEVNGYIVGFAVSATGAGALPDAIREKFIAQVPVTNVSPVTSYANIAELVFANKAALNADAKRLGAQCAYMGRMEGWAVLDPTRALGIQQALQREVGDSAPLGGSWPDPSTDPEVQPGWVVSA